MPGPVLDPRLSGVAAYLPLSLSGRLAAGLVAVKRWLRTTSLQDDQVTAVLALRSRHDADLPLLDSVYWSERLPPDVEAACSAAGVQPDPLLVLLGNVGNGHLFDGIESDVGLVELDRIRVLVAPAGVRLPAAD